MYVNGASSGYGPYGPTPQYGPAPAYAPPAYGQDAYMGSAPPMYPQQRPQQSGGLFGSLFSAIGNLLMGVVQLVRNVCRLAVQLVMSIVGPILQPILGLFGGNKADEQQKAAMAAYEQQMRDQAIRQRLAASPEAQEAKKQANSDLEKWEKWAKDNQSQIKAKPVEVGEHARKQAEAELSLRERELIRYFGPESQEVKAFRERSEALTKALKGEGSSASAGASSASVEFVQNLQMIDDLLNDFDAKVPADKRHTAFGEIKKAWTDLKSKQAAFAQENPQQANDVDQVMKEVDAKVTALEAKLATEPQVPAEIELPLSLR